MLRHMQGMIQDLSGRSRAVSRARLYLPYPVVTEMSAEAEAAGAAKAGLAETEY